MVITGALHLGGGIATANKLVLRAFTSRAKALTVLSLAEPPNIIAQYRNLSSEIRVQAFSGNKLWFAFATWQILLTQSYKYVFCDHVNLALLLAPLSYLGITSYTVRLNGIEVFSPFPNWEGRIGLNMASQRLAISEFTRQVVHEQHPDLKVSTCDLALNLDTLDSLNVLENPTPITLMAIDGNVYSLGKQVILHVGRMETSEQYKGQDTLIHAMPLVLEMFPEAQLVLAGKGSDAARLQMLVHSYSATTQRAIFMPGFVDDALLERLYQQSYVFAMPSRGEGFGLVYLEAMQWAKPCLGSRIDAAQCIIRDGETGLLVNDPTNFYDVGKKLIWLLDNPEIARRMGSAARELVKNYYLFPHFADRFWQILEA